MPRLLALAFALLHCACSIKGQLDRNLGTSSRLQKRDMELLLGQLENQQQTPISWDQAYRRMLRDNLSVRQSSQQLAEARKLKSRIWLDLIPRVGSYVNIGASLSELGDLDSDDISARLVANLGIPNPFQFHGLLYAAALQQQNAEWSHELDLRRMHAQLYEAFVESRSLAEIEQEEQAVFSAYSLKDGGDLAKRLEMLENEKRMLERRKLYHRLKLNQLFNTPGANWRPTGEIPRIHYGERVDEIASRKEFGSLAIKLEAVQIEGAILRVKRVKFQQWPSINLGLSLPPLYTSTGDANFSSDDMLLFSGANKSIDLTDVAGLEGIRNAEKRLEFTRARLRQSREREVLRVSQLISTYHHLLRREKSVEGKLQRLGRSGFTDPAIVIKNLEQRSALQLQLIETRRQLQQLDLQFLIWDETFWKS